MFGSPRFGRMDYLAPAEMGFAEGLCVNAITGSTFDATGANRITLMVFFTRVAGTGNLDLTMEAYDEAKADWVVVNTVAVAAGVETFTDGTIRKATANVTQKYEVRATDLFFAKMRVKSVAVTNATTDTLSISAFLGYAA